MPISNLYSKRNRTPCNNTVYELSPGCRIQIIHLIKNFFKENQIPDKLVNQLFSETIYSRLCEEHQKLFLGRETFFKDRSYSEYQRTLDQLSFENNKDFVIDIVEMIFQVIQLTPELFRKMEYGYNFEFYTAEQVIGDLNSRLSENCVGFKFTGKQMIKVDNETLHEEVIKPTTILLNHPGYENVAKDYAAGLQHFRHQNYEEAILSVTKAFESTLKVICDQKGWYYKPTHTAKQLVDILYENNFLPDHIKSNLGIVRSLLEGSVTVMRNKVAHGSGNARIETNEHIASLAINIAGSLIKFCVEVSKS